MLQHEQNSIQLCLSNSLERNHLDVLAHILLLVKCILSFKVIANKSYMSNMPKSRGTSPTLCICIFKDNDVWGLVKNR